MRLNPITGLAFQHLLSRMLLRIVLGIAILVCAAVAISQFTAAGSLALELEYGPLPARLIIGSAYGVLGVAGVAVLRAMRGRSAVVPSPLAKKREAHLVMLIEAVLLGYSLAQKTGRTS